MVATLALLTPLFVPSLPAHGGAYRPPPPALSGPTSMGRGAGKGPTAGAGPRPGFFQGPVGAEHLDWERWWSLERDRYVDVRGPLAEEPAAPGLDPLAAGMVQVSDHVRSTELALPILLRILKSTRDVSVVSSALIATARMGNGLGGGTEERIASAILSRLDSESQEISETAALSLGILGTDQALETLLQLLAAGEEGKQLVEGDFVPVRTRAFAAYGLGLTAHRRDSAGLRQRIAAALMDVLSTEHRSNDLPVAAMLSLGLCPAPLELTVPGEATRGSAHAHDVVSRSAQLRWLRIKVDSSRRTGAPMAGIRMSLPTLSHAIVALGRLARDAPDPARREALVLLEEFATKQSAHGHLRTSAAIALGQAMTAGHRPADRAGRLSLAKVLGSGQALERRLASIALAEAVSTRGPLAPVSSEVDAQADADPAGFGGLAATKLALARQLARGRSDTMPWVAMALGVQRVRLEQAGVPWDEVIGTAVREKLRTETSDSLVGAYALSCALVHRGADDASVEKAGAEVHAALKRTRSSAARGQIAIALGWLTYEPAREDLSKLMETSRFNPDLLQSAAVALMMHEDPGVIPRLVETLESARSASGRATAAAALGRVGDRRAIEPLLELARNRLQPSAVRAFAIVSLGQVCETSPLPWRTPAAHAAPYFAVTKTLQNGSSGLLDLN